MRESHLGQKLGGGRFELREPLASGGYGNIHRAYDRVLGTEVALKVLSRVGPEAVLSFKNEFRRLADVRHPNVVRLGELFEEEGRFFFSMELVQGTGLMQWVRGKKRAPFDEDRLRDAIAQIATGLVALHASGITHRDLKPDNVLITSDGRAIMIDFGLAVPFREATRSSGEIQGGTAAYMAPEQLDGGTLGPAIDMYALGIVLYELLTGELPFFGSALQIMIDKQNLVATSARAKEPRVPPDLDALCTLLLSRDPRARPSAAQVLLRLGQRVPLVQSLKPEPPRAFIGRDAELDALFTYAHSAFTGQLGITLVEGASGVGKTTLVEEMIARLTHERPDAIVLRGRCHAREQVRFKAVDGLLDDLSRALFAMPTSVREAVLPERAFVLGTLFPVLLRVPGIEGRGASERRYRVLDRHQVFVVLAELLSRVSARAPLVLLTDDLQWGDEDSLSVMRVWCDLLRESPIFWIATARPLSTVPGELGARIEELFTRPYANVLKVPLLAESESRVLGATLLGTAPDDPRVVELAREAAGHPLFLTELSNEARGNTTLRVDASLDDMLRGRVARLSSTARSLLELVAVAGSRVPLAVLSSTLPGEPLDDAVAELAAARFVERSRLMQVVCYHDRVREAVMAGLTPEGKAALHRRLALAYEQRPESDPADVAEHWLLCDPARAEPWLEQAAELALQKAAFERAASAYARLLELSKDPVARHRRTVAYGEALASAGRCAEAARVLQGALESAPPEERVELTRLCAQRLLQAAEVEAGVKAARDALSEVDLSLPTTTLWTLLRLGFARTQLALVNLDAPPKNPETSDEKTRAQLDTLWRLTQPLSWGDMLLAADVSARHVKLARKTGERRHFAFALCAEALFGAMKDPLSMRPRALIERVRELATTSEDPEVTAYHAMAEGQLSFFRWDLADAELKLSEAERRFRDECPEEPWLLANARSLLLNTWMGRGKFSLHAQRSLAWQREAIERGDKSALALVGVMGCGFLGHLMQNAPERAAELLDTAMTPWRGGRFGVQHLGEMLAQHAIRSYRPGLDAYEWWKSAWPMISKSFLSRVRYVREVALMARIRACVMAAAIEKSDRRTAVLKEAWGLKRSSRPDGTHVARAAALQHEAELALLGGQLDVALAKALEAQPLYAEADYFMGRLLDYFVGQLEGGDTGQRRSQAVLRWLHQEGWAEPECCLHIFVPSTVLWS